MLSVVLDTNVIISAVYFGGKPEEVLNLVRKGRIWNITSGYMLDELSGVLRTKFLWEKKKIASAIRHIKSLSRIVKPEIKIEALVDAGDNRVLEAAIRGKAEFIISGDRHLKELASFRGIRIVDPAAFLNLIETTT